MSGCNGRTSRVREPSYEYPGLEGSGALGELVKSFLAVRPLAGATESPQEARHADVDEARVLAWDAESGS